MIGKKKRENKLDMGSIKLSISITKVLILAQMLLLTPCQISTILTY